MSLHRKRQRIRLGLPEAVVVFMLGLTLLAAVGWHQNASRLNWRTAQARVVAAGPQPVQYNASDYGPRADLTYEYTVGGVRYAGVWRGLWPGMGVVDTSSARDFPGERQEFLTIAYDPDDPSRSSVHPPQNPAKLGFAIAMLAVAAATIGYVANVYPWLKLRQAGATRTGAHRGSPE